MNSGKKSRRQFLGLGPVDKVVWIVIIELMILFGICILHSMPAGHYANFWPINGTFQNFNPVRRLLNGQIPFRDFQVYLGLGHLYTGSIATALFGGNYRSSLMAFSFLAFLGLALLFIMVGNAVFRKKTTSLAMTNLILLILIIQPLFFQNALAGTTDILDALYYALGTGNSARFVRGMILPLSSFFFMLGNWLYHYSSSHKTWLQQKKKIIALCAAGVIAGFSFLWSNDYGISCWLCIGIMTFIIIYARERKVRKAFAGAVLEFALSIVTVFVCIEILTLGHFPSWFHSNFGTSGYQFWYYNSNKSYYLFDVDVSYIMLVQAFLCLVYLWKLFISKGSKDAIFRYGVIAYANMVCFCAVNEYRLLSGGNSREVALVVLFATVLFELCHLIGGVFTKKHVQSVILTASLVVGLSWIISATKEEALFWTMTKKDGEYIEQMGGNLTSLGKDLKSTTDFLQGETFFATYASAQEVITDTFQPSGTDYIIHVLGDTQRENYLDVFENGDFKYAATQRGVYTPWEYWIQRANWFFYRKLYDKWHPVYVNAYETYWERNIADDENTVSENISVMVSEIDKSTKKIIVKAAENINGVADLYVNYAIKKNHSASAKLLLRTVVRAQNTGTLYADDPNYEYNYLRSASMEYIPVTVVNGYGEVTLTSCPEMNTSLELHAVNCAKIYTVTHDYVPAHAVTDNGDLSVVSITKNKISGDILKGISEITISGKEYNVSEVQSDDYNYYVIVKNNGKAINPDGNVLYLNNMLRVNR